MKTSQAVYTEPLHVKRHNRFTPSFNIGQFLEALRDAYDAECASSENERKRDPPRDNTARKVRRTMQQIDVHSGQQAEESFQVQWSRAPIPPSLQYSDLFGNEAGLSSEGVQFVPALMHTVELRFSDTTQEVAPEAYYDFKSTETTLKQEILVLCESLTEPLALDLGPVYFGMSGGRVVAVAPRRDTLYPWLVTVPPLSDDGFNTEHYDLPPSCADVLYCAGRLMQLRRARLEGNLKVLLNPIDASAGDFSFSLVLEARCSFAVPTIFEALTTKSSGMKEGPDAQRRLLLYVYPQKVRSQYTKSNEDTTTNIPFLYSAIGPAPDLPECYLDVLQPTDLAANLLPFQRRSVAWLLKREGMAISPNGKDIIPDSQACEFQFWDRIEEGAFVWYLNRLSGTLSPNQHESAPALGGIDSEEPGLGKTLECISLVLLNPASPDRHSLPPIWYEDAKVEAKPVKVSTIHFFSY
jgi:E3 ubiquitin-protein ligase SHPRH